MMWTEHDLLFLLLRLFYAKLFWYRILMLLRIVCMCVWLCQCENWHSTSHIGMSNHFNFVPIKVLHFRITKKKLLQWIYFLQGVCVSHINCSKLKCLNFDCTKCTHVVRTADSIVHRGCIQWEITHVVGRKKYHINFNNSNFEMEQTKKSYKKNRKRNKWIWYIHMVYALSLCLRFAHVYYTHTPYGIHCIAVKWLDFYVECGRSKCAVLIEFHFSRAPLYTWPRNLLTNAWSKFINAVTHAYAYACTNIHTGTCALWYFFLNDHFQSLWVIKA